MIYLSHTYSVKIAFTLQLTTLFPILYIRTPFYVSLQCNPLLLQHFQTRG